MPTHRKQIPVTSSSRNDVPSTYIGDELFDTIRNVKNKKYLSLMFGFFVKNAVFSVFGRNIVIYKLIKLLKERYTYIDLKNPTYNIISGFYQYNQLYYALSTEEKAVLLFFIDKVPIIITTSEEYDSADLEIYYIRYTINVKKIFARWLNEINDHILSEHITQTSPYIKYVAPSGDDDYDVQTISLGSSDEFIFCDKKTDIFEGMKIYDQINIAKDIYVTDTIAEVEHDFSFWLNNKDWYISHGLNWKRGSLLYGSPGTGKTHSITYLSIKYKIPIIVFDLSKLNNTQFKTAFTEVFTDIPHIILFEDFDRVFSGSNPVNDKIPLTFDCILNCLDGANNNSPYYLFITTNNPDSIDPALCGNGHVTRPGRIDSVFEFHSSDEKGIEFMINKIAYDLPGDVKQAIREESRENKYTIAEVKERCIKAVLNSKHV
jgi:hypothetical protein